MITPKKLPGTKGKAMGAAVAGMALNKARAALRDEKTRRMLLEQGKTIATQAQQWRKDHAGSSGEGGRRLTNPFAQARLERRVENLRTSLVALAEGRPELGEALAPVRETVERVALSLEIAGRMPTMKRMKAHSRIEADLDKLEEDLFDQTFGSDEKQA